MKNVSELMEWAKQCLCEMCAIPMVINGGGLSIITTSDADDWYKATGTDPDDDYSQYVAALFEADNEEYANDVTPVTGTDIYPDLFEYTEGEEYTIYRIVHYNASNQENHDIQVATWEL